jgi:hypothetical protein
MAHPIDDRWQAWVSSPQEVVSEWEQMNDLSDTHTRSAADLVQRVARALERAYRLGQAPSSN